MVLVREPHDVATARELPALGPAPCLNVVPATRDGHILHQFPLQRAVPLPQPRGLGVAHPQPDVGPAPLPGGEPVPPLRTTVNRSFAPFGVTVVLTEEDGYRAPLTETFAPPIRHGITRHRRGRGPPAPGRLPARRQEPGRAR